VSHGFKVPQPSRCMSYNGPVQAATEQRGSPQARQWPRVNPMLAIRTAIRSRRCFGAQGSLPLAQRARVGRAALHPPLLGRPARVG
jgi:hypothetical protein